jgi:hypothetical protein
MEMRVSRRAGGGKATAECKRKTADGCRGSV